MSDRIEYLKAELKKAEADAAEEQSMEQMRQAARQTRMFIDAMAEVGISEERAWKMIFTALKK